MNEYICTSCGSVIEASSEAEAMAQIEECEEYF
jgi:hypothetical protein